MAGTIPKPQLRNLHVLSLRKTFVGVVIVALATSLSWKTFIVDAKRNKYDIAFEKYDLVGPLDRMNKAGLMQSHPIDE